MLILALFFTVRLLAFGAPPQLRQQLEAALAQCRAALHPAHELCFQLLLILINCCSGEQVGLLIQIDLNMCVLLLFVFRSGQSFGSVCLVLPFVVFDRTSAPRPTIVGR